MKICWRVDERVKVGDECRVGTRSVSDERARSVLIVDDDEVFARALARVLKSAGFIVTLVESGFAALELLKSQVFALILTDLQMPRMTGLELLKELRLCGIQTQVVVMSGISEDRRGDALGAGAIAYLRKPFANSELVTLLLTVTEAQPVE